MKYIIYVLRYVLSVLVCMYVLCRLLKSVKDYGVKIADASCGKNHTLIVTEDGEVLSCGVGEYGRLGRCVLL